MNYEEASDDDLLAACPDVLCVTNLLKATPRQEGGKRIVYIEASNEDPDLQGEIVLAKALAASASYFCSNGNLDIDHYTVLGPKMGIKNCASYEIGQPIEVKSDGGRTFVKGQIYTGSGPAAEQANLFWSSLTDIDPPQRWFPSVAGDIPASGREIVLDPQTKKRRVIVKSARWLNIGFSKTPANSTVPNVSTVPIGIFAKSWGVNGIDVTSMAKALSMGYGTDSAQLDGGAALRLQSIHGGVVAYQEFRDSMLSALEHGAISEQTPTALAAYASEKFKLTKSQAVEYVERFMKDPRALEGLGQIVGKQRGMK